MKKQNKIIRQYKFLRKGNKSENGDITWKLNKWVKVDGELEMCKNGLHSCEEPYDAFTYVQGEILAIVECRGEHLKVGNKHCWREQRVIKTYKWTKKDSLRLAIFSAELCLKNFERKYPNDKRPREAIEAAKKVLIRDTEKNRATAWSATWDTESAAEFATKDAARDAAWSVAWAAAMAARGAAWAAARATGDAAWFAARAAEFATESAGCVALKKIKNYFRKIVKEKEK